MDEERAVVHVWEDIVEHSVLNGISGLFTISRNGEVIILSYEHTNWNLVVTVGIDFRKWDLWSICSTVGINIALCGSEVVSLVILGFNDLTVVNKLFQ